jgi:ribonuclease HI
VKGHSGDPDNDRCDAIAVAFSRGAPLALASGARTSEPEATAPAEAAEPAEPAEPAPAPLQQLLSRLEVADRLARGGHGLSLLELAQLIEQPVRRLEQRRDSFPWRDWRVEPLADGRWRLVRETSGLAERE